MGHFLEIKCPVCGGTPLVFLFIVEDYISSHFFDLYRCAKCDVGLTMAREERDSIDPMRYYGERYYGKRKGFVGGFINYARARSVKSFLKKMPQPVVIDVGCGNGSLMLELRKRGFEAFGTEVAPPEHFKTEALLFVRQIDFKEKVFPSGYADAVMFWHVLEHLLDPLLYLVEAERVLKKGGLVIIEVPNFKSWQARLFKANWLHLDAPRHVLHFSPESIILLLQMSGFTRISFHKGSFIYGYFGYLQSFLNTVSAKKNLFFDFLNGKVTIGMLVSRHTKDLILNVICFFPALILGGALFFGEITVGQSGIMLAVAEKGS